jgi:hypothetical protein
LNILNEWPCLLGLDLNIDSASSIVTGVLAAELIDALRPARFAQLMRHLPLMTFRRCVARYAGEP